MNNWYTCTYFYNAAWVVFFIFHQEFSYKCNIGLSYLAWFTETQHYCSRGISVRRCRGLLSYCKFWIYWVGVNTKFTIWQLHPPSKFKIYNITLLQGPWTIYLRRIILSTHVITHPRTKPVTYFFLIIHKHRHKRTKVIP